MDGGAWWAAVHGVSKSRTRLSDFTFTVHFHALEKEMATHPSVLAWRIPGTGKPGGLPSMGLHRVRHDWRDLAAAATEIRRCQHWERHSAKWLIYCVRDWTWWMDTLGSSLGKLYFFQLPISQQFHLKIVQSSVILKALLCTVLLVIVPRTFRSKKRRQMVPDKNTRAFHTMSSIWI